MSEQRSDDVQRFRRARGAARLHILTAFSPQRAVLDRFVLLDSQGEGTLIVCSGCPLESGLDEGQSHAVAAERVAAFRTGIESVGPDWPRESIAPGLHDGITVVMEWADDATYRRTRTVDPPEGSPPARLLNVWQEIFPAVRRVLR